MVELHFCLMPLHEAKGQLDGGPAIGRAIAGLAFCCALRGAAEVLDGKDRIRIVLFQQIDIPHIFRPIAGAAGGAHGKGELCDLICMVRKPLQQRVAELPVIGPQRRGIQAFMLLLQGKAFGAAPVPIASDDGSGILGGGPKQRYGSANLLRDLRFELLFKGLDKQSGTDKIYLPRKALFDGNIDGLPGVQRHLQISF